MAVFDVGSTLVDESKVYEDRMKKDSGFIRFNLRANL